MYYMSESEFMQYEMAEERLRELRYKNKIEIQSAYDGIHPTRVAFNYSLGVVYSESVNVEDYAIYLVELKQKYERQEKWWGLRAEARRQAFKNISDQDKQYLQSNDFASYGKKREARKRLKDEIIKIVATNPELQRRPVQMDVFVDMEETDKKIEEMSMDELMKDYWAKDEEQKRPSEKKKIPERVTTNLQQKAAFVSDVTVSYLPINELEEYRGGKKGGSKWFPYSDYLKMKDSGLSNKQIAEKTGISLSMLNKRLRVWKGELIVKSFPPKQLPQVLQA